MNNYNDKNKKQSTEVQDFLKARSFSLNRLWTMEAGVLLTDVDGEILDFETFHKRYPIPNPTNFYRSTENPDKTKQFLI